MPLVIKVFDFDRVSSDDPMGMVTVDLSQMGVDRYMVYCVLVFSLSCIWSSLAVGGRRYRGFGDVIVRGSTFYF